MPNKRRRFTASQKAAIVLEALKTVLLWKMIACHHSQVPWTGEYAPRFQAFFLALSFSRFDGESQPSRLTLTHTVSPFRKVKKWVSHLD